MDKAINDVTNVIMKCKNEFEAKKTVMKSYKGFNFPNKDKLKTVKRFLSFLYSEIEKRKPMFDLKAMEKSLNPHSLRQYGREQILEEKLNLTENEKNIEKNCSDLVNEFANNHLNTNQSLQAFKKFLYELSQCINNKHVGDAAYNLEKITLNNIIKSNIIHEDIEICSNEKISSFYYINPDFIINNLLEKTGYYPTGTYIKLILYLNGMSLAQLNSSRCKNRKIMHGVIKLSDFQNSSISYMPSFCTVNETELIQKNGFIAFARHVYSLLNNKHIILKNNDVVGNYLTQIEIISGDNELLNRILSVRGSNRNNNSKSCRLCNINGLDFSKITTCESVEKVEKRFNTDIFFKCQQYYFDIFHDISEGVLPLMSYQIVYWLLKNKIIPKQDLYKLLIRREIIIRKMSDLKYVLHKNSFARLIPDYNKKPKFLLSGREHLIFGRVLLSLLEDVENKNDKVFKECLNELDFSNISLEDSIVEDDVSELDSSLLLTSFEENKEEELDEMPDISVVPKIDQHTKMVKQYKNMLYHLLHIHYLITSNIEKTSLVNALKKSVDKFFITFNLLFPGYNYSIKYHNLLHYHEMIENVDFNVRNALTINFESTHQRLKRNIAHSHNNMNVYFSSLKQSTMSYLLSSKDDSYKEYDYLKHKFKLNL